MQQGQAEGDANAWGVKVSGIAEHTPPRTSSRYEQWCTRNGITPYAASKVYAPPSGAPASPATPTSAAPTAPA
jgi:hypothetical protein